MSTDNTDRPEVQPQTEFNFDSDDDEPIQVKDEPVETDLGAFFDEFTPDENRARKTRIVDSNGSTLLEDKRDLSELDPGEQEKLIREVAEDQLTLDGDDAREITELVEIAASTIESEEEAAG